MSATAAAVTTSTTHEEIDQAQFCDLAEESSIIQTTDLGGAIVHTLQHPQQGRITLFDTAARYLIVRV